MHRFDRRCFWLLLVLGTLFFWVPAGHVAAEDEVPLTIPEGLLPHGPLGEELGQSKFLPSRQKPDGSWSAQNWDRWWLGFPADPEPRLPGLGTADHDLGVTALSMCAYLGAGYTTRGRNPNAGILRRSARWLKKRQRADGSFLRAEDADPVSAHAIASLTMIELYGMTGSPLWKKTCLRALSWLAVNQRDSGALPSANGAEDHPLATFWAAMAWKSASLVNKDARKRGKAMPFPTAVDGALARAVDWFRAHTDAATGVVRHGTSSSLVLSAAGALLRVFDGETSESSATLSKAQAYLAAHVPAWGSADETDDGLYIYIATLACFQAGGAAWSTWKKALDKVREEQSHNRGLRGLLGSWEPRGTWAAERGRVAMTALCAMSMQVFYRYPRVFGGSSGGALSAPPRIEPVRMPSAWARSSLPLHAAQMRLERGGVLPLDALHVRADVQGVRAQVVLDLFVTNTGTRQEEGLLDLRFPDGASPYYLAFGEAALERVAATPQDGASLGTDLASLHEARRGEWGHVLEARMAPLAQATEAFETIVRQRRDPALLTWAGAGVYHLRVFPLLPGRQHRIIVAYEIDLHTTKDGATLQIGVPEDVPEVRVAVRAPGASFAPTPTARGDGALALWSRAPANGIRVGMPGSEDIWLRGEDAAGDAHTAGWVTPEVPRVERTAAPRAQILLDVSGSVDAEILDVWRTLLAQMLTENRDVLKRFAVGFFDTHTRWWREGYVENTAANVAALEVTLSALDPGGATDLRQALAALGADPKPADVFLFTDGRATWGPNTGPALAAALPPERSVFVYDVGMGAANDDVLRTLAAESGGCVIRVLGRADVAAALHAHRFEGWVLRGASLAGLDDLLVVGGHRRLHPGQRLRLAGRGIPQAGAPLVLTLRRQDQSQMLRIPVQAPIPSPMAPRAYGVEAVGRLERRGGGVTALAVDYAMHYRVVRASCALVMLETEADYKRFGLDTKGHAARVRARPAKPALEKHPRSTAQASSAFSLARYARKRGIPSPLLSLLKEGQDLPAPRALPEDTVSRALSLPLESAPSRRARRQLAMHALGSGYPETALAALLAGDDPRPREEIQPVHDWFLARVALVLQRPLLALVAYEAALTKREGLSVHGETLWVIAADYERFLIQLLRTRMAPTLQAFVSARLETLALWRTYMGAFAPPKEAALVALHLPFDERDWSRVIAQGPSGRLRKRGGGIGNPHGVRWIPSWGLGEPLQMLVVQRPPAQGCLRLDRDNGVGEPGTVVRSLVMVIRDWGRRGEKVALMRSIGPTVEDVLLTTLR